MNGETGSWTHIKGKSTRSEDQSSVEEGEPEIVLKSDPIRSSFRPAVEFPQSIEKLSTPVLTGGTVQDPFVLEVWGQPEPDIPASTSAVNFSDAVGGAVIDLEAGIYMVPSDAEDGAGFRDTGINYPVGLRSGGMITFTASADTPTTLGFRLTGDDSVGEVSELYHEITIDSSEPKAYEVSLQPGSTSYFSELVMSVVNEMLQLR